METSAIFRRRLDDNAARMDALCAELYQSRAQTQHAVDEKNIMGAEVERLKGTVIELEEMPKYTVNSSAMDSQPGVGFSFGGRGLAYFEKIDFSIFFYFLNFFSGFERLWHHQPPSGYATEI